MGVVPLLGNALRGGALPSRGGGSLNQIVKGYSEVGELTDVIPEEITHTEKALELLHGGGAGELIDRRD